MSEQTSHLDAIRPDHDWKTVDDVVMGGRSSSHVEWIDAPGDDADGFVRFRGTVSLENNGGFCSARLEERDRGVAGVAQLELLARADGRRYKCTLRTADTPSSSSWRRPFETTPGEWRRYQFSLDDFELWRRGTLLADDRTPDPAQLTSVGLLIADGCEGDFQFDLAEVRLRH